MSRWKQSALIKIDWKIRCNQDRSITSLLSELEYVISNQVDVIFSKCIILSV